jgi:cytochrome c oxidase subunit IV
MEFHQYQQQQQQHQQQLTLMLLGLLSLLSKWSFQVSKCRRRKGWDGVGEAKKKKTQTDSK